VNVAIGLIFAHGFPTPPAFIKGLFDWYGAVLTGSGNAGVAPDKAITGARLIYSEDFPIDAARNDVCRVFLAAKDYDYLVFLDADMRHPAQTIHRLVGHGLPVVTGRYQMRKPPFHTVAMRKTGDGPHDYTSVAETSGLVPIDGGGAGVLAIRRDVLDAMRARVGENWFQYQVGPNGLRSVSEDMWFYQQAIAAGFQPMADLDLQCSHVASFEVGASWHVPFREAFDQATLPRDVAVTV
jgi:hypothetical protein